VDDCGVLPPAERPKVSIVIPTRDREGSLPECLDRLLAQSGPVFEIVVVDTSSSVATQEILRRYPSVVNQRLGDIPYSMVLARNWGISVARGDIVVFIDDDCYVRPQWLGELTKVFEYPNVIAAGGRIIYHPWKTRVREGPMASLDLDRDIVSAEWDREPDDIVDVPHLPGGNCAVRRDVALAVGGFDTRFTGSANLEETDFFLRVSKTGGRMVFVPTAVVEHRALPRADHIARSHTNYIYRYSVVRNRLYFLRKHRAAGLILGLRRQMVDAVVGTAGLLFSAAVFFVASVSGIIAGLLVPVVGKSTGLCTGSRGDDSPREAGV